MVQLKEEIKKRQTVTHAGWISFTLLILRLTAVCPVARTGSMENLPDGSSSVTVKMELIPVSVSLISILRLARGVPNGTFSWIVTLYSGLLNVGGSSLTSRIVMVRSAVVLVLSSSPEIVVFTTNSSSLAAAYPGRGWNLHNLGHNLHVRVSQVCSNLCSGKNEIFGVKKRSD